jgi:hypothetical protein
MGFFILTRSFVPIAALSGMYWHRPLSKAKFISQMSQTDQDSIDRHSKKTKIRNQIKMESIVLLFSTIAVTGLAVFIIFWLFVVHII